MMVLLFVGMTGLVGQTIGSQQAAPPALPSIDLPPLLARVLTDYETAWRARDAGAVARLFANDRVVVPNACPPVKSRDEVERCYAGSGGPLSLRAIAYGSDGTMGYIIGAYAPEKGQPDIGKFMLTLVKGGDGRWLIVSDMDRPYRRS